MNMADRIQYLRKVKGITQEELADKIGVSRQAVSKWESQQSCPDLEKVIIMSDYFEVTTDYILKGIEPVKEESKKGNETASKILYITSTVLIAIGLLCVFAEWNERQTMEGIVGAMVIQMVGVASYFIGRVVSLAKPSFVINWINVLVGLFIPSSIILENVYRYFYLYWPRENGIYVMKRPSILALLLMYTGVLVISFIVYKKYRKGKMNKNKLNSNIL